MTRLSRCVYSSADLHLLFNDAISTFNEVSSVSTLEQRLFNSIFSSFNILIFDKNSDSLSFKHFSTVTVRPGVNAFTKESCTRWSNIATIISLVGLVYI